jgi:predicted regulator of Ras-like GTPase activity (Roadblock/LC7/MglB family)
LQFNSRILADEAAGELQELLITITKNPDVTGALVVGYEGLLLANFMPETIDAETIAACGLNMFRICEQAVDKINHSRLHQIVSLTSQGQVVCCDFGGGLLVVLSDARNYESL